MISEDVPLGRLTTIGTGGSAFLFARPRSVDELVDCLAWAAAAALETRVIGLGSNLLVSDRGVDGLVIRLDGDLASITIDGLRIVAGGGASLAAVVSRATRAGLAGIEFGCAIPGTVGGAVRMNAGAYGGEMVGCLETATIASPRGVSIESPDELEMRYRHSRLHADEVVASATLLLEADSTSAIQGRVRAMQDRRGAAQPKKVRTFGSVFKNPPGDRTSGQLIEACGLKGLTIGGARVSPVHANFIENVGGATSADVVSLMREMRRCVLERFEIDLHHEVELVGPFDQRP